MFHYHVLTQNVTENSGMEVVDPWNIGTLNKPYIWGFYSIVNYAGVILCSILMGSTVVYTDKTSLDILIFGLCSGCWWMSATCGSQCLVSWIYRRFYGGEIACQLESFFHISAILTQFIFVALIAVRSYLLVVHNYLLSKRQAILAVMIVWVICIGGTWGMSEIQEDDLYLMSAGTYCFFGFSTPPIAEWLVPGLALSLSVMIFCYASIIRLAKQSAKAVQTIVHIPPIDVKSDHTKLRRPQSAMLHQAMSIEQEEISKTYSAMIPSSAFSKDPPPSPQLLPTQPINPVDLGRNRQPQNAINIQPSSQTALDEAHIRKAAISSAWFVLILLVGWYWAAVATVYEFSKGYTPEWMVTAVGVHGVLHSVWVPLRYAYVNRYHKETMWIILTFGTFKRTTMIIHSSTHSSYKKSSPSPISPPQLQQQSRLETSRNDDVTPKSARGTRPPFPAKIQLVTTTLLHIPISSHDYPVSTSLPDFVSSIVNPTPNASPIAAAATPLNSVVLV